MKRLIPLLTVLILLAGPMVARAQEGGGAAAPAATPGITVFVFVLGLMALLLVGFYHISQNRPPSPQDDEE